MRAPTSKIARLAASDSTTKIFLDPCAVTLTAGEGEGAGPPTFESRIYSGGFIRNAKLKGANFVPGVPVVVDLAGMTQRDNLAATLDHKDERRVGNFQAANTGQEVIARGTASAANPARDEVVQSHKDGYKWQASIEVQLDTSKTELVRAGQTVDVNGRTLEGPCYVCRASQLDGFSFVTRGADADTVVSIAAHEQTAGGDLDPEFVKWAEEVLPGTDLATLNAQSLAGLQANWRGQTVQIVPPATGRSMSDEIEELKERKERQKAVREIVLRACDNRPNEIETIQLLAREAEQQNWSPTELRLRLFENSIPPDQTSVPQGTGRQYTGAVLEAAVCQNARFDNLDKHYSDQVLQAAHDRFKGRIGLKELMCCAAETNGYRPQGFHVTREVLQACFPTQGGHATLHAATGFSTINMATTLSNIANKFLTRGWNFGDQTPLRVGKVTNVSDFKQITTVALTGDYTLKPLNAQGQLTHAVPGEVVYKNQADSYGRIFGISHKDWRNDDLGALTAVPQKIGRGGILMLNHIFWAEFLDNSTFFSAGNNNVVTGPGALNRAGLDKATSTFKTQKDPDGENVGTMPRILLVPTSLESTAGELMTADKIQGSQGAEPDTNIWRGRYQQEASPYLEDNRFTGYSAAAWYLLADPDDVAVIEIVALDGQVQPTVETADASFNTLGVEMRGHSHVGVKKQEFRGGVRADGSTS